MIDFDSDDYLYPSSSSLDESRRVIAEPTSRRELRQSSGQQGLLERSIGLVKSFVRQRRPVVLGLALTLSLCAGVAIAIGTPATSVKANKQRFSQTLLKTEAPISLPTVYVDVVGAVKKQGLYKLPSSSRVFDAVNAAGGFTRKADQTSVNLARKLQDGEQILVLMLAPQHSSIAAVATVKPKVNLNRASGTELDTLPGVGPAIASRIIAFRTTVGAFQSTDQLLSIPGIGPKLVAQLRDLVTY